MLVQCLALLPVSKKVVGSNPRAVLCAICIFCCIYCLPTVSWDRLQPSKGEVVLDKRWRDKLLVFSVAVLVLRYKSYI